EHEPVVFPPRRRPDRAEELRDLRLRKQDVRDGERALKRQAGANEVATLREGGVAVEDEDRGDDRERDPARAARDVAAHGCPVAVCRRLIARGGSSRGKNPTRDADELARPTETDERVKTKQRDDRDGEHLRTQASLEPSCEWRVADGEEHRRPRKR